MISTVLLAAACLLPLPREYRQTGGTVKNPSISEKRDASMKPEEYRLTVTAEGAEIVSADARGAAWARESLKQLETPEGVKCCEIRDWPEYPLRVLHIDEGRHFMGKEFILKTLSLMRRYKLNMLHWHLTEDQGWRIQIDKYPNLTTYGATRLKTAVPGTYTGRYDNRRYGPYFYTKKDIREIVAEATRLGIEIMPEIEMPGHTLAIVAAYPELGCPNAPLAERGAWSDWGICDDGVCAGNDDVLKFYRDVIDEVCELFPGAYIHMGGDERTVKNWAKCPKCQARKKALGLKRDIDLQGWMTDRIMEHLSAKGRKYAGYGASVTTGSSLDPAKTLLCVTNGEGIDAALRNGYRVLMAPIAYCYWDFNQSVGDDPYTYATWWAGSVPANQVFSFDPRRDAPKPYAANVLGGVAYNWSEYTLSPKEMEWKIWPRAIAFSQALWNPQSGYVWGDEFAPILEKHVVSLRAEGVNAAGFQNGYKRATAKGVSTDNQVLKQD